MGLPIYQPCRANNPAGTKLDAASRQEPRLFFDKGDVVRHVLLQLWRVVLEIDRDQGAVAERVDFLQAVPATTAKEVEKPAATACARKVRRFMDCWFRAWW
jgi:hypothetical protein